jgi:hypothetical protein
MTRLSISRDLRSRLLTLHAVLVITLVASSPPFASAAPPTPIAQAAQALGHAQSYRADLVTTYRSSPSESVYTNTTTVVAVRHGKAWALYIVQTMPGASGHTTMKETVDTGVQACTRLTGRTGAWDCHPTSLVRRDIDAEYSSFTQPPAAGFYTGAAPLGRKMVRGQRCVGYRKILSQTAASGHTMRDVLTLWVTAAAPRMVEQDITATLSLGHGHALLTAATTLSWSNWNDPTLTIPSIPAS